MIVSGLEFCCHCSYCFYTVLYTLSSYIIYRDALQGNDYHNFSIFYIEVHISILHTDIYMYTYVKLHHIHYPLIQNKYVTLQTGCVLTSFSILVEQIPYYDYTVT